MADDVKVPADPEPDVESAGHPHTGAAIAGGTYNPPSPK